MIVGIIGKPNSGKTTFFNSLTLLDAPTADYPFTTIKANVGVAYLRTRCVCREFGVKDNPRNSKCIDGWRFIPVKVIDVAGLVPGASRGRGLGNRFLDDLRQADALIHVVDASGSTDEEGRKCPPGSHDPLKDVEFVEDEIDAWMFEIVSRGWGRMARSSETGSKISRLISERLSGLKVSEGDVIESIHALKLDSIKPTEWDESDLRALCREIRSRTKPILIAANKVDLPSSKENVERLKESGRLVIPCASEAELLLKKAWRLGLIKYLPGDPDFELVRRPSEAQLKALELVREKVLRPWGSTGVQQALNSAYFDLLHAIVVYPVEDENRLSDKKGNVLPDAYVMYEGDTARDLAYKIHTELGDGFLFAIDVKRGRRVGADYELRDGDVIKIVSTAKRG